MNLPHPTRAAQTGAASIDAGQPAGTATGSARDAGLAPDGQRRVALVTGSAKRLGRMTATALHAAGADVIVHHRNSPGEAAELCAMLNARRPGSAIALQQPLDGRASCRDLARRALRWRDRLDVLVNNASEFFRTPLQSTHGLHGDHRADSAIAEALAEEEERALQLFASNCFVPAWLAIELLPALRRTRGAIVNVQDISIERPLPGYLFYTASKAALASVTRSLALEAAPEVRVNAVSPGSFDWPDGQFTEAERRKLEEAIPLARIGEGRDLAEAIVFLALGAAYVNGVDLKVDGGQGLTR
ncbi:SDR family oxidoreductase [Derxia gummosa]|uniref:SDR family oxidoreductase n=1 Tax=Derxia gummosa DSM 723 TaxID=1121388 RepID=A0A8B6X9U7_9BURK|nr:SDR family oxidoreductase [Derxia gummosa]